MEKSVEELQEIAGGIRRDVVEMVYRAGSGHLGGSLSCVEILVALYFGGVMSWGSQENQGNQDDQRDRFILSAGHYCPTLYSVLARTGYFPREELASYGQLGSKLQSHPHNLSLPGIEVSSGALGQGLSVGIGKALALKHENIKTQEQKSKNLPAVFVLMSDGEQDEGQVWEAAMTAAKYKLDNLIAIIDKNEIQIDGTTDEIMPLGNLKAKYEAFGWEAVEVEGHRIGEVIRVIREMRDNKGKGKPKVVVAKTVFGKGVSFMERNYEWHSKAPNREEFEKAIKELI